MRLDRIRLNKESNPTAVDRTCARSGCLVIINPRNQPAPANMLATINSVIGPTNPF